MGYRNRVFLCRWIDSWGLFSRKTIIFGYKLQWTHFWLLLLLKKMLFCTTGIIISPILIGNSLTQNFHKVSQLDICTIIEHEGQMLPFQTVGDLLFDHTHFSNTVPENCILYFYYYMHVAYRNSGFWCRWIHSWALFSRKRNSFDYKLH